MSRFPLRMPGKASVEGLQSELSNLVERWWHCGVNTGPLDGQDWAPAAEIAEEADCYRVTLEVPGVSRSSIDVTAVGTTLQITGDKLSAGGSDQAPAPKVVYTDAATAVSSGCSTCPARCGSTRSPPFWPMES